MQTEDLHSTIARVRIALLQSQVREKTAAAAAAGTPASPPSPIRRRRSTVTAVQSKDGVPLFTKQKTVRVVF